MSESILTFYYSLQPNQLSLAPHFEQSLLFSLFFWAFLTNSKHISSTSPPSRQLYKGTPSRSSISFARSHRLSHISSRLFRPLVIPSEDWYEFALLNDAGGMEFVLFRSPAGMSRESAPSWTFPREGEDVPGAPGVVLLLLIEAPVLVTVALRRGGGTGGGAGFAFGDEVGVVRLEDKGMALDILSAYSRAEGSWL